MLKNDQMSHFMQQTSLPLDPPSNRAPDSDAKQTLAEQNKANLNSKIQADAHADLHLDTKTKPEQPRVVPKNSVGKSTVAKQKRLFRVYLNLVWQRFAWVDAILLLMLSIIVYLLISGDQKASENANYMLASESFKSLLLTSQIDIQDPNTPLAHIQPKLHQIKQQLEPMLSHPLAQANLTEPVLRFSNLLANGQNWLADENRLLDLRAQHQSLVQTIIFVKNQLKSSLEEPIRRFQTYQNETNMASLTANANRTDLFNALNFGQGLAKFEALQTTADINLAQSELILNAASQEQLTEISSKPELMSKFLAQLNDFNDIPTKKALKVWLDSDATQAVLNQAELTRLMSAMLAAQADYQKTRSRIRQLLNEMQKSEQFLSRHIMQKISANQAPYTAYYLLLIAVLLLIINRYWRKLDLQKL